MCSKGELMRIMTVLMAAFSVMASPLSSVVTLSDLSKEQLEAFAAGELEEMVVEIPEGLIVPFSAINITGDLLKMSGEPEVLRVEVMQTCFVRSNKGGFELSSDGVEWAPLKRFFTGTIGGSLSVGSEGGPCLQFNMELNKR